MKQLESSLRELISNQTANFSIFIHTPEGNIAINDEINRKAASLAKLFILAEAFRQIEDGLLSKDEQVDIDKDMMVGGSGVISYLTNSHTYRYQHLIELMIIVSDNTAANVLLDRIGMSRVNSFIKKLGCNQSLITRRFMDDHAQSKGLENITSAKDIVTLLQLFTKENEVLSKNSRREIMKILSNQQFNTKLPSFISEDISIYHKTGELVGAEHDAGILRYQDKEILVAVLSEDWDHNGTAAQVYLSKIGEYLFQYLRKN